jgi:mRNA interferase MazF
VIVSADLLNEGPAGVVIVVPVTTARRDIPSHIELDPTTTGLTDVSYAKGEDVRAVSDRRLVTRLGTVGEPAMHDLGRVLRYLLDL